MEITEHNTDKENSRTSPVLNGNYFEAAIPLEDLHEDKDIFFPFKKTFSEDTLPLLGRAILDYGIVFPFIVRFYKGKYYVLSHIGIFRALKYVKLNNPSSTEDNYSALIFSAHDEPSLILAMTESLEFRYLNPFVEGEILALLKYITGNTYRNLSLMLSRSKSRIEALVTIARMRPDLRIKILHRFPRPPLEFLEEIQRADRHGNSEFISALLHSDGKQETLREIKKKFNISKKRKLFREKNKPERENNPRKALSRADAVLDKIPRQDKNPEKNKIQHKPKIKNSYENNNLAVVDTNGTHKKKWIDFLSTLDNSVAFLEESSKACYEVKNSLSEAYTRNLFKECLGQEFILLKLHFQRDNYLPFYYKGLQIADGFFLDFLVEKSIPILVMPENSDLQTEREKLKKSLEMSKLKAGLLIDNNKKNTIPFVVYNPDYIKKI